MSFKQYRSEPLTEPEKRYLRKKNGVKSRFAVDNPISDKPKDRDYLCPTNITQTISRSKRRGFNGCKMSPAARAMVESKRALNAAFHIELKALAKRGDV
jgi:hypothetical protein